MPAFIVIGTIVDATDDWKLRIHEDCLMVIDRSGKIVKKCDNNVENLRDAKERCVIICKDVYYFYLLVWQCVFRFSLF